MSINVCSSSQKGLFVCQMPSTLQAENKNKNITDKLEVGAVCSLVLFKLSCTFFPQLVHMYTCTNYVFTHPVRTMYTCINYVFTHHVCTYSHSHYSCTYVRTISVVICTVQTVLQLCTCCLSCTYIHRYVHTDALSDIYVHCVLIAPVDTISTVYSI